MPSLPLTTRTATAEVPYLDSSDELIVALECVIAPALSDYFNDVAWGIYFGNRERKEFLEGAQASLVTPAVKAALWQLPSVIFSDDRLALNMVANGIPTDQIWPMIPGSGSQDLSAINKISDFNGSRYAVAPAHNEWDDLSSRETVKVDIAHAIGFSGEALVAAIFKDGYEVEVIENHPMYRGEPALPVYRDSVIGSFFLSHTLERS